jgi:hypothetical protein
METVMTRSIFDPTSGETEHSGSRFLGPDADEISHMPTDVVDGKVKAAPDSQVAGTEGDKEAEVPQRQSDGSADGVLQHLPCSSSPSPR